jgi:hypothetical protein
MIILGWLLRVNCIQLDPDFLAPTTIMLMRSWAVAINDIDLQKRSLSLRNLSRL